GAAVSGSGLLFEERLEEAPRGISLPGRNGRARPRERQGVADLLRIGREDRLGLCEAQRGGSPVPLRGSDRGAPQRRLPLAVERGRGERIGRFFRPSGKEGGRPLEETGARLREDAGIVARDRLQDAVGL